MTAEPLSGMRIFVAEDEYLLALDLCDTLTAAGAKIVGPARSHAEAVDVVAEGSAFDVGLLDLNLAGESSADIARTLRRRGTPLILTTGYDANDLPCDLRDIKVCVKPVSGSTIVRAISALMQPDA